MGKEERRKKRQDMERKKGVGYIRGATLNSMLFALKGSCASPSKCLMSAMYRYWGNTLLSLLLSEAVQLFPLLYELLAFKKKMCTCP